MRMADHIAAVIGVSQGIVRLLDHLKIRRAHLVGFSMGAIIAGHVVTTDPDRFITATFVGCHPVHAWSAADQHTARTAQAQGASLLISDFDGEKIQIRSGLALWVYADEQFGGTSEAQPTLIHPGANESRGALRILFRVTDDFPNPFAGVWAMVGPEGLAHDLSAYRGVRFYVRSKERHAFTAGIVRFPGQLKRYTTPLETRTEWTLVQLPFDTFREVTPASAPVADAPPLVANDITSIGFSVAPGLRGEFELDVDRIEFYR